MEPHARTREQRKRDTLDRLGSDVDAWVATAGAAGGEPYLVPLSFLWDGATMLFATPGTSITARNLAASGKARIALGSTRDVVLIEGDLTETVPAGEIRAVLGDRFAERTGFDPRQSSSAFAYFRIQPVRIQAWREENELSGRDLMRGGDWIES